MRLSITVNKIVNGGILNEQKNMKSLKNNWIVLGQQLILREHLK